uniref:Neurotransmitter-gated ion-channel ligand-binding domain-containing protein n=1 Tax=Plectus sambesii TaxID=2011161 RepID=A0A914UXT7_9BILA
MRRTDEIISLLLSVTLNWTDSRLAWNSSIERIYSIFLSANNVWHPDLQIVEELGTNSIEYDQVTAVVESSGEVTLTFHKTLTIPCQSDFRNFPFDSQVCALRFRSQANSVTKLDFVPMDLRQNVDLIQNNPEWTVDYLTFDFDTKQSALKKLDGRAKFVHSEAVYLLKMQRRPKFYLLTTALPSFILTTIALVGIFAPSGMKGRRKHKISIGLAIIFALTLELNVTGIFFIESSSGLPLLCAFVLYELILIGIATLSSACTCIINQIKMKSNKQPSDRLCSVFCVPNHFLRDINGAVNFWQYSHRQTSFVEPIPNKPPKFGVKVLPTSHFSSQNMDKLYQKLDYLTGEVEMIRSLKEWRNAEERRRLKWATIFDRIDMIIFLFFFLANCALTVVMFLIVP